MSRRRGSARRARPGVDTSATRGGDSTPDPATIRRLLPAGHGFLSYHLAPSFAAATWVTHDADGWLRLADDLSPRLSNLADRLDFQWTAAAMVGARRAMTMADSAIAPPGNPAIESGFVPTTATSGPSRAEPSVLLQRTAEAILAEMHALVWRPLVDAGLREDLHWIVSPHGSVHRLPLPALLGVDGPLVEKTSLRVVPSARIWIELQKRRRRTPRRAYVAGVPSAELPAVEHELAVVCGHLAGWEVVVDPAPTRDTLRREGAQAGLVHLAAHGALRKDNPAFSSIQLADGPLMVHDLASFRLPGSTVVLTACSSGRGIAPSGDEWIGLARGFLQAGASSVVASLWPIGDESTLELAGLFYRSLATGQDVAQALRSAMTELRNTRPHPWHWASFALLGRGGTTGG